MTNSKAIAKPNTHNTQSQKVPQFFVAAVKRAKNARASARLLEAMEFIRTRASLT